MNEISVRTLVFTSLVLILIFAEYWSRRYSRHLPSQEGRVNTGLDREFWRHFINNSLLLLVASVLLRGIPIFSVAVVAIWAERQNLGVFHQFELPEWVLVVLCVLILDMLIYWQHRWFHRVPLLWRLHKVHHSDSAVDLSSALRFHPLELLISQLLKMLVVLVLGIPLAAVLLFEILLSSFALFAHSRLYFGPKTEKLLPLLIVSPAMHRVHHSCIRSETDSNFTTILSVWDRVFGSYRAPVYGEYIRLGLNEYLSQRANLGLWALLCMPFVKGSKPEDLAVEQPRSNKVL